MNDEVKAQVAKWILKRAKRPHSWTTFRAMENMLVRLSPASILPIVGALERQECLPLALKALSRMEATMEVALELYEALRLLKEHADPDVRRHVYRASRALPQGPGELFLLKPENEQDLDVLLAWGFEVLRRVGSAK